MVSLIKKFPIEGILIDVILGLVIRKQPVLDTWVAKHFLLAFWFAAPMQLLGLYCAMKKGDLIFANEGKFAHSMGILRVFCSLLAAGGFMWMFLPALAMDTPSAWNVFVAQFFICVFGGVLVVGLSHEYAEETLTLSQRLLTALGGLAFLMFSRSLFAASAATHNVSGFVVLLPLGLAYLPVRLMFVLRTPFNPLEFVSAMLAFASVVAMFLK